MKLLHGLEERIPSGTAAIYGLQHVLAMFVGIVTPPLLVGQALGLDVPSVAFLVSMSLFTSGITTCVQVHRFGPVGSGLLSVQGTSFVFVGLAIDTGKAGGLPLIFGLAMAGALVPILISRCIGFARRIFPPIVTGSVVLLIGVSLIQVGFAEMAGGFGSPSFGSPANLALGLFVMAAIVLLHRFGGPFVSSVAIAVGMAAGYLLAFLLGRVDFAEVGRAGWATVPTPLRFGLAFDPLWLLPWMLAYMTVAIECIGDLTATSAVSGEPVFGPVFVERLKGGVLSDGLGCLLTSFFNALPKTTFAQNNGVIAMTGVALRRVGVAVAGMLAVLGILPRFAAVISVMPKPVLGGATVIMFAMVAVAGLHIIVADGFAPRDQFILAITLALGLGVAMVPNAVAGIGKIAVTSEGARMAVRALGILVANPLAIGAVTAIGLNLMMPRDEARPALEGLREAAG